MNNLGSKLIFVVVLVGLCVYSICPPQDKLKPGIDLAGGTSLLYQIDTTGLTDYEKSKVSEDMIRILQRRIDPGNQRNLVWRPHGSDRLEIQMPLATKETQQLRKDYQDAVEAIENHNIDIRLVTQALIQPAGMSDEDYKADRATKFEAIAGGSEERLTLLNELAQITDTLQTAQSSLAASLIEQNQIEDKCDELDLSLGSIDSLSKSWDTLDDPNRAKRIEGIAGDDETKKELVAKAITLRKDITRKRHLITAPEEGLKAKQDAAWDKLESSNVDLIRLEKYLTYTGAKRSDELKAQKAANPDAEALIDNLTAAYDKYAKVAGRLDDPEDLIAMLRGSGVLEFRILPSTADVSAGLEKDYIERLDKYGPKKASDPGKYIWVKIKDPEEFTNRTAIRGMYAEEMYVLASDSDTECLKHVAGPNAWRLKNARLGTDQFGAWAVDFSFDEIGANRFWALTSKNINRPLCILLDEEAISAPNINSAIRESGQITSNFSQTDALNMVDKLNAGSLPARLGDRPISINTIGPTMGKQNLDAGWKAGVWGLGLVLVFMLIYYCIAGSLAGIALMMNMLLILSVMAVSRATFTMPGIAGLILTIGMAVDANVLIFERIREEMDRGSSLRISIKNGYERAFSTIMDANITTFIVGLILWILASEEVKGFALILMIGIVSSIFTALFVTRLIFDYLTEKGIVRDKLTMMQAIRKPNVKWMSKRPIFFTLSALMVIGGWYTFLSRDESTNSKYSIEFTGGTSIHVVLSEEGAADMLTGEDSSLSPEDKALILRGKIEDAVQAQGEKMENPLIAAARVQRVGEVEQRQYEITTTETNIVNITLDLSGEETKYTQEQVQSMLVEEADKLGDDRLAESIVSAMDTPGYFMVETHQTNVNNIAKALNLLYTDPTFSTETNDVVSQAVRDALGDNLEVFADLKPALVKTQPITDEFLTEKPYLADYAGGLYLEYTFDGMTAMADRITDRLEQSRFKAEFEEQYGHNKFEWFAPNNKSVAEKDELGSVEIAVTSADLIYGIADATEWDSFVSNEEGRFQNVFSWEASLPRVTQIDASVGHESMNEAMIAIVISLIAIVAYIWIRFGNVQFGLAAVAALVHDISIAMGLVAASAWLANTSLGRALMIKDFKIDLPMIAGFLTVIGYSLNDTIVVFDRIRENRGKMALLSERLINNSINQTLSRTLLTSMTTMIVLIVMYIWGGEGLRSFNYVLIIGVLVGTYSSIGIASPLLCSFNNGAAQNNGSTEEDGK